MPYNIDALASEFEDEEIRSSVEEELMHDSAEFNKEIEGIVAEELDLTEQSLSNMSGDDLEIKIGWKSEGGIWYYFDELGHKAINDQYLLNEKYYRFDETGKILTGWYEENDKTWVIMFTLVR